MGISNEMNRLVACVAFSGDLNPNASAAAVALVRHDRCLHTRVVGLGSRSGPAKAGRYD